jgi:hypothetical protein
MRIYNKTNLHPGIVTYLNFLLLYMHQQALWFMSNVWSQVKDTTHLQLLFFSWKEKICYCFVIFCFLDYLMLHCYRTSWGIQGLFVYPQHNHIFLTCPNQDLRWWRTPLAVVFSSLQTTTMERKNLYVEILVNTKVWVGSAYFWSTYGVQCCMRTYE